MLGVLLGVLLGVGVILYLFILIYFLFYGQTHPPPVKVPVPPSKDTGKSILLHIQISVSASK
jgi:hypothetical protein